MDNLDLWEEWYLKILADFFQENNLKPKIILSNITEKKLFPNSNKSLDKTILLLNDGSMNTCVAIEILKKSKLYFTTVLTNSKFCII